MEMSLMVKLASLAVHAQELDDDRLTTTAAEADVAAIKALAEDPEVEAWLTTIDPVLLPAKR